MYTFIDLFAGAGGLTEGLMLAGSGRSQFKLIGASDINEYARLTHEGRFKEQLGLSYHFLVKDIRDPSFTAALRQGILRDTGLDSVDVVCGGPPCQGFSVYGSRNELDPRNDLFKPYLEAVTALRPRYFVMENVPGLTTMYGGRIRSMIERSIPLVTRGLYRYVGPVFTRASDFGVPQIRERVVYFGCRADVPDVDFGTPQGPAPCVSVREAISDLAFLRPWESASNYHPDFPPTSAYQAESRTGRLFSKLGIPNKRGALHNHEAACHTPDVIARFAMIEKGHGLESVPRRLWDAHLRTRKKWCVRLDESRLSYTVTTLPDDLIHYAQHRILTVREMARLQSFDDTFVFRGPRSTGGGGRGNRKRFVELPQYTQVGNAVPPLLAKAIGEALLDALAQPQGRSLPAEQVVG